MNVWYVICDIVYNICKYDVCMNWRMRHVMMMMRRRRKNYVYILWYIYIAYIDTYHLLMMV